MFKASGISKSLKRFGSFATQNYSRVQTLDPLDRSFMKVVGGDVDIHSDDYRSNYESMAKVNA